jgi:hypothetical protein
MLELSGALLGFFAKRSKVLRDDEEFLKPSEGSNLLQWNDGSYLFKTKKKISVGYRDKQNEKNIDLMLGPFQELFSSFEVPDFPKNNSIQLQSAFSELVNRYIEDESNVSCIVPFLGNIEKALANNDSPTFFSFDDGFNTVKEKYSFVFYIKSQDIIEMKKIWTVLIGGVTEVEIIEKIIINKKSIRLEQITTDNDCFVPMVDNNIIKGLIGCIVKAYIRDVYIMAFRWFCSYDKFFSYGREEEGKRLQDAAYRLFKHQKDHNNNSDINSFSNCFFKHFFSFSNTNNANIKSCFFRSIPKIHEELKNMQVGGEESIGKALQRSRGLTHQYNQWVREIDQELQRLVAPVCPAPTPVRPPYGTVRIKNLWW